MQLIKNISLGLICLVSIFLSPFILFPYALYTLLYLVIAPKRWEERHAAYRLKQCERTRAKKGDEHV